MGKPLHEKNEPVPPISDPVWVEWSDPLLKFLQEGPKTWTQLERWRKPRGVSGFRLRNCLAWLEDRGVARSEGTGQRVKWMGSKTLKETDDGDQIR
jgi:hypothetical protein